MCGLFHYLKVILPTGNFINKKPLRMYGRDRPSSGQPASGEDSPMATFRAWFNAELSPQEIQDLLGFSKEQTLRDAAAHNYQSLLDPYGFSSLHA